MEQLGKMPHQHPLIQNERWGTVLLSPAPEPFLSLQGVGLRRVRGWGAEHSPRTSVIHGDPPPKGALMQNQSGPSHPWKRPFPSLAQRAGKGPPHRCGLLPWKRGQHVTNRLRKEQRPGQGGSENEPGNRPQSDWLKSGSFSF